MNDAKHRDSDAKIKEIFTNCLLFAVVLNPGTKYESACVDFIFDRSERTREKNAEHEACSHISLMMAGGGRIQAEMLSQQSHVCRPARLIII